MLGIPETQTPQLQITKNSTPRRHRCRDSPKRKPQKANTQMEPPEVFNVGIPQNATPRMQNDQNAAPQRHQCWDSLKRNPQNANSQNSTP